MPWMERSVGPQPPAAVVVGNLMADLLYAVVDPRVRGDR